MKLLVISDTHGKLANADAVIKRLSGKISAVLHMGDMIEDARELEAKYKSLTFHYVAGNCDFYFSAEPGMASHKIIEYFGVKIFLTHGHREGVKRGYGKIAEAALKEGAAAAVCGHTHEPFNAVVNGVLCVNPGSLSFPRGRYREPSYAVIEITEGSLVPPSAGVVFLK